MELKKEKTLYGNLLEIEETLDSLEQVRCKFLELGLDASKFSESHRGILDIQKDVFREYSGNPILEAAISGESSIGRAVDELSQPFRGLRGFYLPRFKNEKHHKDVACLSELIEPWYAHKLDKRGIFAMDNVLTSTIYCGIMAFGILHGLYHLSVFVDPSDAEKYDSLALFMKGFLPGAMTVGFGLITPRALGSRPDLGMFEDIKMRAGYIDEKIKEVFNEKEL